MVIDSDRVKLLRKIHVCFMILVIYSIVSDCMKELVWLVFVYYHRMKDQLLKMYITALKNGGRNQLLNYWLFFWSLTWLIGRLVTITRRKGILIKETNQFVPSQNAILEHDKHNNSKTNNRWVTSYRLLKSLFVLITHICNDIIVLQRIIRMSYSFY